MALTIIKQSEEKIWMAEDSVEAFQILQNTPKKLIDCHEFIKVRLLKEISIYVIIVILWQFRMCSLLLVLLLILQCKISIDEESCFVIVKENARTSKNKNKNSWLFLYVLNLYNCSSLYYFYNSVLVIKEISKKIV